ncbi:MAG: DNA-3-methyladenine glycosylase 2 family protein [Xanthomonadaceae bacterium]|nr:DNA-3-methyladenine glycosylase 2 family protein [Xanthomonadaceae bacterium]
MELRLEARAPFRLDLTVWALRRQPGNRIDTWQSGVYRRCFGSHAGAVLAEVHQYGSTQQPMLQVRLHGVAEDDPARREDIVAVLRRMLGLDVDLSGFYAQAAGDPDLEPLALRYRGLKPPRFATLFEALANAVACQQVSLASGIALLGRLSAQFGPAHPLAPELHAFPHPRDLCDADPAALRALGFSQQKAGYLTGLARDLAGGKLTAAALEMADDAGAMRMLSTLRGIKRWSAQYVALRGLGRLGVFPVDDVGAHKHLAAWLGLPRLDAEATAALVQRWQPYAGLLYFHVLLKRLEEGGYLQTVAPAHDLQHAAKGV